MASARDENFLLAYRTFLLDLSAELSSNDLEKLKLASSDLIPRRKTEDVARGFELFDLLEQDGRITRENLSLLKKMLEAIRRADLAWKVQQFASDDANTPGNVGHGIALAKGSSNPVHAIALPPHLTMASDSLQQSQEHGPNKVQVTILASEWGSSKGGLSTINRELAIQLAKFPEVQITYFLPKCSEEDRKVALSHDIKILEAKRLPGYEDLEKLSFPPTHLEIDVIVGHGVKLGHQAQVIRNSHKCKWIQVIHTDPEELGMFKSYENPILRGEEKHNVEVELCEMADFVVAIGPKLAEAFRKYLRFCQKHQDVFDLTPGIFEEFVSVQHVPEDGKYCSVLVFGRGDAEDFTLKGFDIAAKAVAALPETSLMFVGAPDGKHEDIAKRLLEFGLPENRLRVRGYVKTREDLKRLFHEVDLVLMPSRTEGFGLTGLEALSAGLPVIVSKNSGFGEALSDVPFGSSFVIDSEDPNAWTAALKHIWNKKRQTRLYEAKVLRDSYGTKYGWSEQCEDLVKKMFNSVNDASAKEQTQILFTSESFPSSSVASLRTEDASCEPQMQSEAQSKLKRKSDDDHTSMEFDVSDGSASWERSTGNGPAVLQDDMEHDGIGDEPEKTLPFHDARNDTFGDVEYDGVGDEPEKTLPFHDARNHTFENQEAEIVGTSCVSAVSARLLSSSPSVSTFSATSGAQGRKSTPSTAKRSQGSKYTGTSSTRGPAPAQVSQSSARLQLIASEGPAPVRYVNFLAYGGYSVEILGGKHFKTPDGEFVEIKSGTQYEIHVKNSHPYGCNLDISIDGYDVGGWVVDGRQEITIERSAYEAKKFTFYRVKRAPKEAGIEPGRDENGLVKCVFTPEAFVGIPVIIPGSSQPLMVNFAPSARIGDLKTEIQRQLDKAPDPDQILSLNHKVLGNRTPVSDVIKTPGMIPQLIDDELDITIKVSTSEIINVRVRPSQAKVNDLMKQVETRLGVPIKDQKMYHEKTLLSDTPRSSLPLEVLCSSNPTVDVTIPEYIEITVENSHNGDLSTLKVDKEKPLSDLMTEIPSCRNLENNQEAVFHVNGRELSNVKDTDTLASLGIYSGSQLKVDVRVLFISVSITDLPGFSPGDRLDIRCNPEETFKDLLNHIQSRTNIEKIDGATFLMKGGIKMKGRIFDPTQDLGSLQDYGIEHRSSLAFRMTEPQTDEEYKRKRWMELEQEVSKREEECGFEGKGSRDIPYAQVGSSCVPLGFSSQGCVLTGKDPSWRTGGTTLQGHSTQHFVAADPINVDQSKKVELLLRLVAREDETDLEFPNDECTPLSTLYPSTVPE
ncbi:uncharacterized protein [Montipora foliosa]|uniref:uncharacterized protein isoform X4 n=1 Tax=Montipora foliosa TaxID=591990 RepID=UPI0035F21C2A